MQSQRPNATDLRVHDVDMPRATGFSNETVFFSASYREGGAERSERLVARIEPRDLGIFPIQTSPACDVSVGLQHRVMTCVERSGVVVDDLNRSVPDVKIGVCGAETEEHERWLEMRMSLDRFRTETG